MRSDYRIPVQTTPQDRPIKRHHTARYYAHRVKESLTTRVSKLICSIFLTLLFLVGIISFILWLSLRPHRPRFHVQGFSLPDVAQEGGFQNAQIIYNVTARNSNQNIGVYYDSMQVAVFYEDQSIGGASVLFPFYQEPKNTTVIAGQLSGAALTVTSQRWQQFMAARTRGEVVFRLEVTSVIRFRISTWDSKRHRMHANCPVGVGPDGLLLPSYRVNRCPVYFS
ncbi:protein yls9 [Phtheirospermum japonicum]|uniref:Protein yls9 n=1 Tax=Phtheirospermum japonicum TaxID=374723 RepID=A0A830B341_9LAMI|nr:protein yls9 [Phtheirospermum japonicum]